MSTTEAERHHLIDQLVHAIGKEAAMTLAANLPPTGWADVATRQDLEQLEARIDLRFEAVDHRFDALEHKLLGAIDRAIATQTRTLLIALVTLLFGFGGLLLAAVQLGASG